MTTIFALWETRSGNIINDYATEEEALAVVRETIEQYGLSAVVTFSLVRETPRHTTLLAEGQALADRALSPSFARKRESTLPAPGLRPAPE